MMRMEDHCRLCADMTIVSSIIRGPEGRFETQSPGLA